MYDSIRESVRGGKAVDDALPRRKILKRHVLYTGFFSAQGAILKWAGDMKGPRLPLSNANPSIAGSLLVFFGL